MLPPLRLYLYLILSLRPICTLHLFFISLSLSRQRGCVAAGRTVKEQWLCAVGGAGPCSPLGQEAPSSGGGREVVDPRWERRMHEDEWHAIQQA
ncbi:hypothetical protein PVAP13_3KG266046 [Panicum virgatum]|uniref:Uncharacterized protein n=1 Tax=Panicum virgatum TaxID=38727 RepID=A0A8T0UYL2_PANVG|nr:hypothetical protein PVAP13_3KG266046 [Panicum virgatum]